MKKTFIILHNQKAHRSRPTRKNYEKSNTIALTLLMEMGAESARWKMGVLPNHAINACLLDEGAGF
jgi:hypothetical protein